jgi:hypothetical protein
MILSFAILCSQILNQLHYWPVYIGTILAWVALASCPLTAFAMLRQTVRPALLLTAFLATLLVAGVSAFQPDASLLLPTTSLIDTLKSLTATAVTANLVVITAGLVWRRVGYRLHVGEGLSGRTES